MSFAEAAGSLEPPILWAFDGFCSAALRAGSFALRASRFGRVKIGRERSNRSHALKKGAILVGNLDWFSQHRPIGLVGDDLPRPDSLTNSKLLAQSPGLLGIVYAGQAESEKTAVSRGRAPLLNVSDVVAGRTDPSRPSRQPTPEPTPTTYTGEASFYPDDRRNTASGIRFDPRQMSGAMSPARVSKQRLVRRPPPMAIVIYTRPGSKTPTRIKIPITDHGPWLPDPNNPHRAARDPKTGKPIPHPTRIIDLSPAAYEALTGEKAGPKATGVLKNVTVEMLPDEPVHQP